MNKVILVDVDIGILKKWHWDDKLTFKEIGSKLKCSVGKVHNIFKKLNIPTRPTGHRPGCYKPSNEHIEKLKIKLKNRKFSEQTIKKMSESAKESYRNGKKPTNWNGGRRECRADGYIQILKPDHPYATKEGYVFEHRLVMEEALKRFLTADEVVHHINGNKKDNSIENLMIFSSLRDHTTYHGYFRKKAKINE